LKRHLRLQPLSHDHHRALVLARHAQRAADRGADASALAQTWSDVAQRFGSELEPHFRIEEAWLFPDLVDVGEVGLAERALADHARLRELVREEATREIALEFAELLERHVRFEERELFPRVERLLAERADTDPRRLAETVRQACITAAITGYEDAALSGLCREGAWEAAVSAMRALPLDTAAKRVAVVLRPRSR
jgi:hemerythrin-like domain-containing protein